MSKDQKTTPYFLKTVCSVCFGMFKLQGCATRFNAVTAARASESIHTSARADLAVGTTISAITRNIRVCGNPDENELTIAQ